MHHQRAATSPARSNETHASTTDPDARLARKSNGEGAKLAFTGHLRMENRNALVIDARLTRAIGTAEPDAALAMLAALAGSGPKTVGTDKNYDTAAFVASSRAAGVTPHVAQNINAHRSQTSTGGRPARLATGSARLFASGSRRQTAGSRRSAAWRKPSYAVCTAWQARHFQHR